MRDIGKNIRELRIKKNMTQDALAESLFVTRQTVSNYETGKSRPDVDMLVKISEIFDCDVNHVLYGAPEEKKNTMLRSLLIAVVICVLSGLPLLFSVELEKMARYWQSGVSVTLKLIVQPFFLLCLGWTVMQSIKLITRPKPLKYPWAKYLYWALLSLVLLYFTLQLPTAYHNIKASMVYTYINSQPIYPPYGISSGFDFRPNWLDMFGGNFSLFILSRKWLFFAVGMLLCLLKSDNKKTAAHVGLTAAAVLLSLILFFFAANSSFTLQVTNPEDYIAPPYGIAIEQWTDE